MSSLFRPEPGCFHQFFFIQVYLLSLQMKQLNTNTHKKSPVLIMLNYANYLLVAVSYLDLDAYLYIFNLTGLSQKSSNINMAHSCLPAALKQCWGTYLVLTGV